MNRGVWRSYTQAARPLLRSIIKNRATHRTGKNAEQQQSQTQPPSYSQLITFKWEFVSAAYSRKEQIKVEYFSALSVQNIMN